MKRALALLLCCAAAGCGQNMETQPKYFEYEPAPLFRDGRVLQAPVAGTVAGGDLARAAQAAQKPPLRAELLDRGHEEFDVVRHQLLALPWPARRRKWNCCSARHAAPAQFP